MSRSRRPSVSIHDYPEHLNPFSDDITSTQSYLYHDGKAKDPKHKFWTFGKSRKKRSNSFSIKSTWNGLFGKRKEDKLEPQEKRSTITTVSSTYKRETYTGPPPPAHPTKDQQDFDEALGTLVRRRKYTLDNSSPRYSSSLTVNGDPARLYDGSPKDTTASIMGDLTPKPPARRFGQMSPKPTDKISSLNCENRESMENGGVALRDKSRETTPVPPLRRFGNRASQRTNASTLDSEDEASRSGDVTMCDENENVPGDYIFKRFSQDAVRKSNLSINSCVSIGSTMSSYGRKKRKAPQPPRRPENVETNEKVPEASNVELQIVEPMDIARVTENIDDLTKKSNDFDPEVVETKEKPAVSASDDTRPSEETEAEHTSTKVVENNMEISCEEKNSTEENSVEKEKTEPKTSATEEQEKSEEVTEESIKQNVEDIQVEYHRASLENIEIIKDVEQVNSLSELDEVCLRKKDSLESLSRSNSFCVKEEIEKIERQIKALETRTAEMDASEEKDGINGQESTRYSILENRRHFFQNLVENDKDPIKIEFKEFPREQKDIHVVRLNDSPVPVVASKEPVKVIELHISEPIRQKPEILQDVNPIPKPARRHSALNLNGSQPNMSPKRARKNLEPTRGQSL
ncbi:unnamed protein product [Xylocopa violacea]|uniref:Uncharacterized protein n=1 Tax=Xylocopa violacea TaxID=135666 RepID=A0ABP1NZ26_XYLVO